MFYGYIKAELWPVIVIWEGLLLQDSKSNQPTR